MAAVSDTAGSISTTPTSSSELVAASDERVGAASRSGRADAGTLDKPPRLKVPMPSFFFTPQRSA